MNKLNNLIKKYNLDAKGIENLKVAVIKRFDLASCSEEIIEECVIKLLTRYVKQHGFILEV